MIIYICDLSRIQFYLMGKEFQQRELLLKRRLRQTLAPRFSSPFDETLSGYPEIKYFDFNMVFWKMFPSELT